MGEFLFDEKGNIFPPNLTKINLEDFWKQFVDNFKDSKTRKIIWEGYKRYLRDYPGINEGFLQWLNGSYITTKLDPRDIDLVSFISFKDFDSLGSKVFEPFLTFYGISKEKYMVDGYLVSVYSEDDPRCAITIEWINYWKDKFGKDRQNNVKGILFVEFPSLIGDANG